MADLDNPPADGDDVDGLAESTESTETTEAVDAAAEGDVAGAPEPSGEPELVDAAPDQHGADNHGADRARTAAIASLRVVRGLVGVGLAAALAAAVGLVAAPSASIDTLSVVVDPQQSDLLRACPGPLLRLGDAGGGNAAQTFAVGSPEITISSLGGDPSTSPLGADGAATSLILAAGDDAALAGTQSQRASGRDGLAGLAIASCTEPTSSSWLMGGATTVGRTALLVLTNPTEVPADVTVKMWGENGPISAPGMSGLRVAPGGQRVIPLSGFATDLVAPMVHIDARGGQVTATLQTSVIRVIEPGGVDIVTAGSAPSGYVVVPAVRISDSAGVSGALGRIDHEDLDAIARIGNPGSTDADVEVSVRSATPGGVGTSFVVPVPAGQVVQMSLSAGFALGEGPLPDGSYTVSFVSDEPIVAAVRASTTPAVADGAEAGPVDLAWFASASALRGDTLITTARAGDPVLVIDNPDAAARIVSVEPQDGSSPQQVEVPASGSAAVALAPGTGYLLRGVDATRIGVSYAETGLLSAQTVRPTRQAESSIVVRP